MDIYLVTFLVTFLVSAHAGPVYNGWKTDQGACAQQCFDNNKFNYQPGTTYEFSYDAKTTTKMNGASEDSATIYMSAKVGIEALSKCDFVMRIKDGSFRDSLNDQDHPAFKDAMMNQPVKFSFQDGRIDQICATDDEPTWILNIKKGILSAFQNSMDNFDRDQNVTETDVVGSCDSEYKVRDEGQNSIRVEKTKNILSCQNREGYRMAVQSVGYNVPSFVKSLPLMRSEHKCTQILDVRSKILLSSTCSEEHVFRPFSNGKNGAMTNNVQVLTFERMKKPGSLEKEIFNRRSSLLFEHQFGIDGRQEKEGKIEERLEELCRISSSEDVRPELPEKLNELAASLREEGNHEVFAKIYAKITKTHFCRKNPEAIKQHFLDAIPMAGTVASVKAMKEFIIKKYVTGQEVELWLLSLSFIQRPSREIVAAASDLLDIQNITENVFLSVSSLASGYCNKRTDCGKDVEISHLIQKLTTIAKDCNPENGDTKRITVALRALGNIGRSYEAVGFLSRCLTNRDTAAEIRIAAMDAFRRIPCEAKRSDLMGVFRDESEDSELRLNAYIALMKCPSRQVLSEVRQVLEKEKSNQVGSFVWSHLTNLMETSDPHFQDIRNIVQDEQLKKEFNLDQRKFSRNYEGSFFFDSINTGAKVDSNVIFSEKSFIPRSANLNLTINMFGHAINFLEFGGRVQGLEKLIEKDFFYSRKRSVKPEGLGILKNSNKFGKTDEFSAFSYLRVFGNELRFWDNHQKMDNLFRYIVEENRIEFQKSLALLDASVVLPTCLGLPLNLTLGATGSAHFNRSRDRFPERESFQIKLTPSAALQVKAEMSVDGHLSKAGLKMVTVAHTSTAVILKLSWEKIGVEIPKSKTEIFNLKSDFFILQRNTEKKQKMLQENAKKFTVCTGNTLKHSLGLSVCQHVQFPNASRKLDAPYFPFTGPVLYDLHIRNDDAPKGYELAFKFEKSTLALRMDTPGSRISRLVTIIFSNEHRILKMDLSVPWKNMKFKGELSSKHDTLRLEGHLSLNNKNYSLISMLFCDWTRKGLEMLPKLKIESPTKQMIFDGRIHYLHLESVDIDMKSKGFGPKEITWKASGQILPKEISAKSSMKIGKNEYAVIARVERSSMDPGFKYSPYLKVSLPSKDLLELKSDINYDPYKKFTFDFQLSKLFSKLISLNVFAAYNSAKGKNIARIQFRAPRGSFRVTGDFSKKKSVMSGRVITSYVFGSKYSDRLTLSSKLRDLSLKNSARYLGIVELSSKKKPSLNFKVNAHLAKASNHLETKFDLQYGHPQNKATNKIVFSAVANRSLKPFVHAYSYTMSLQHPGQNMDYKIETNHVQSSKWPFKKFENDFMLQLAPKKVIQTKVTYNNARLKGLPVYEGEVALSYPGRDMKMTDRLIQVNRNTFENHFTVKWQKGKETSVKSTYTKTGKSIYNIENILNFPNQKETRANAMLQTTSGDYKVKVKLDADENSLSGEKLLYAAEASLTTSGKGESKLLNLDLIWAPTKKISANVTLAKTSASITSKLTFSTPFTSMRTFDGETKYSWNNGKYYSLVRVDWNEKNQIRQDLSITHPGEDMELNYMLLSNIDKKISSLKLGAVKMGRYLTASVKVNLHNTPKLHLLVSHQNDKNHRKTEGELNFDILGVGAEFKINRSQYTLRGESSSNGVGILRLPLKQSTEMKAFYHLKNQNELSSLDLGYSSSLRNVPDGNLTIEIRRDLPKMFEAKVRLVRANEVLVSVETKYLRKGNGFNVDVNIQDPYGEKVTIEAKLDLDKHKTLSDLKIKSKPLNLMANSAIVHKKGRYGVLLKILANSRQFKASADYEKDGVTHRVTGSFELPDGRSMDGKMALVTKGEYSVALLINSPDFPLLRNADIYLKYNGDLKSSVTKGYVKVLPYLKECEFEMSVSLGEENPSLSFDLKTPYGNMRTVKATLSLQGKGSNDISIKSEFELNKNKVIDLEFNYKLKSIKSFSVSLDLKTSHRKLDVISFSLKHSGGFDDLKTEIKAKAGKEADIYGKLNYSPSKQELLLSGEFKNLDDFEVSFIQFGNLNYWQSNAFYKLGGEKKFVYSFSLQNRGTTVNALIKVPGIFEFLASSELDMENISYNLKSHMNWYDDEIYKIVVTYEHLAKLYLKTLFPSYKDEMTLTLNGDLKTFNAVAKFNHNSKRYELIISNQGYYRKIDAQLVTPFFTDMASFIFNGDQETFNAQAKFMHESDQYEFVVSNRNYFEQLTITLSTPFSSDQLYIESEGDLSSFKSVLTLTHNKVEYKLHLSNEGYYERLNAKLVTPAFESGLMFKLKGTLQTFNSALELSFNNKEIKLIASNKNYYKQMGVRLVTPFSDDSLSFSLDGTLNSFNAKIKYMRNKDLYEIAVYNSGFYREMEAQLSTPYFRDIISLSVDGKLSDFTVQAKVMHNHMNYQMAVSMSRPNRKLVVELTTPLFEGSIEFSIKGMFQSFNTVAKVLYNNDKFQFVVSTSDYYRQMRADLFTPYFKESAEFLFNGTLRKFNTHLTLRHNKIIYEIKASNREFYRQLNLEITTPIMSCALQFEGTLQAADAHLKLQIGKAKYECEITTKKYFQISELKITIPKHTLVIKSNIYYKKKSITGDVRAVLDGKKFVLTSTYKDLGRKKMVKADLKTPYFQDNLQGTITGNSKKFNANMKLQHDGEVYVVTASNKNYYNELDINLKALGNDFKFQFEGNLQKCKISTSLKTTTDLYEISLTSQNYFRNINLELITPQIGKCTYNLDFQGNWNNFGVESKLLFEKNKYELNVSLNNKIGEYKIKFDVPKININGKFIGNLESFSFGANAVSKNQKYGIMASMKNYFREISAQMISPQLGEQSLTMKINGKLRNFSGFIEVKNNNQVYRSEFSLDNQEFNLSLPVMMQKLELKLKGNWKNFDFMMQAINFNGERIEMSASNKNFKEIKAHLAIPRMNDMDAYIKTSGNLRNGKASMKMSFGENVFESDFEISFDGSQASFTIQPSFQILGKSGKSKLRMDLMFDAQSYKYEFESDFEKFLIKSTASMKLSPEINILMTASVPSIDSEMKLRLVSEGLKKTDIMLNLKSSWTGATDIFYEHTGQHGRSFSAKGYIEREGKRVFGFDIDTQFADNYSFHLKVDYGKSQNKIESKGELKFQGVKTMATLTVNTPFRFLKEVSVTAQTKMLRDGPSVALDLKLPNQEHSLNFDLSHRNFNALFILNMDKKNKEKQFQFQTSYKNTDRRGDISRSLIFKMVLPEKTIGFDSRFEDKDNSILVSSQLLWDGDKHHEIGTEFTLQKGDQKVMRCRITTPRRNVELFGTFSEKGNHRSGSGYIMLDADRSPKKIEAKADLITDQNQKNIDLLLKFPNQKNGIRMKALVTGFEDETIFSCKSELSIEEDPAKTFTLDAKLMAQQHNYSLQVSASHPSTDFEARMLTFVAMTPNNASAGMDLMYMNVRKQRQNIFIRGEIDKLKKQFNFKMHAPSKDLELNGFVKSFNRVVMSVKKIESGKEDMEAALSLNPNDLIVRAGLNYDLENPKKLYRVDAAAQAKKVTLKAYRMEGRSRRGIDTRLIAEIRPSDILYLSFRWNPNFLKDFNKFMYEKLRNYGAHLKRFGLEFSEVVSEELMRRMQLTHRTLMLDLKPVLNYFETEHESLYRDASKYLRNLEDFYRKDNFYLKTIKEWTNQVWNEMWLEYKFMIHDFSLKMNELNELMSEHLDKLNRDFDEIYGKASAILKKQMSEMYNSLENYVTNIQDFYLSMLHDIFYSVKSDIILWLQDIPGLLKEIAEDFKDHPYGQKMLAIWSDIGDSFQNNQDRFNEQINGISTSMSDIQTTISQKLDSFRYISTVDAFLEFSNEVYQQAVWAYRYWNVKSNILRLKDLVKGLFYSKLNEVKRRFIDFDVDTIVFAPKRGEVVLEFRYGAAKQAYLVFKTLVDSLEEMQTMFYKYNVLPESGTTLWDVYYMFKSYSQVSEWVPPFKAHATLFGGQHITTFDGRHFDFKGVCSYLMVRDFVNGDFNVVVNFNSDKHQQKIKSISVITASNNDIEIFSDYKVKFNGVSTNLPIEMKDGVVVREGDLIVLKGNRGYQVTADLRLGLYTVEISGWYFSRVAGLFGTYNHEPSDDMTMYNSLQTEDVEELASSWWSRSSSTCRSHRNFARRPLVSENKECFNHFVNPYSPFRNCFKQVKPNVFYHMCQTSSSKSHSSPFDICDVSSFYMNECQKKGVGLQMPTTCVSCSSMTGSKFYQGEEKELRSLEVPAAGDVIFVVEERKCNSMVGLRLPDIFKYLTSILAQKGLETKFGLIGFGGSRKEPNYIRTMDGEMMYNSARMTEALKKLNFSSLPANVDVMKAVMRAAEYPFRTGVRKTIILVTCTGCHETDVTTWELAKALEKFDITLHVLADHDFKTKGNLTSKTTSLYGADKSHAYSEGILNAEMETNIVIPEDNCVQLALDSNGSYFDSKKLEKSPASIPFMESFAERISESSMPAPCQICDCLADQRGVGHSICRRCPGFNENASMLRKPFYLTNE